MYSAQAGQQGWRRRPDALRIRACCVVGRGAITALTAVLAPGGCVSVWAVLYCDACTCGWSALLLLLQSSHSHLPSLLAVHSAVRQLTSHISLKPLPPSPHPSASHNLQPVSPPLVGQADPRTLDRRIYPPSPSCTWQICSRLCTSPHFPITNSAPSRNPPRLPLRDPDRQCL
jgi:hypothetical protein